MNFLGKIFAFCLLFFALVYLLVCFFFGSWLQTILVKCNKKHVSFEDISDVICSEQVLNELRYRSWFTLEESIPNPSFELKTTLPIVSFRSGKVKTKFHVSWFGCENTMEKKVIRQGGYRIPVEVELSWDRNHWIVSDVLNFWFAD